CHLRLGQHESFLRTLSLERLQPLLHGLQIVPEPHAAHAERRNGVPLLFELVGDPHLAEGRPLDRHLDHGFLDRRIDPVLLERLAARHLGERQIAALLVELLEAIEAVAAVSHDPAGLADAAELLGQLQEADLRLDDLLFRRHCGLSILAPPIVRSARPPGSLPSQSAKRPTTLLIPVRSNLNFYTQILLSATPTCSICMRIVARARLVSEAAIASYIFS